MPTAQQSPQNHPAPSQALGSMPPGVSHRPAVTQAITQLLQKLESTLPVSRRLLHAGDAVYRAGDRLQGLYVVNSGIFKTVSQAEDGREQVVSLHFKGDWLGFDGIAEARHDCDAVSMDVGEVWCVSYPALMQACAEDLSLMALLNGAMSKQLSLSRQSVLSLCTLPADARVADFLRSWAQALADRGLRDDQITLRMTRAEIGSYLGMTLETVSRALSRLARAGLITFAEIGRRELQISSVAALATFVQRPVNPKEAASALH